MRADTQPYPELSLTGPPPTHSTAVCQVSDDVGEALVSGALESAGVSGTGRGQVLPHRVLYCSTAEGKV